MSKTTFKIRGMDCAEEVTALKAALAKAWQAATPPDLDLGMRIQELVEEKYSRSEWNLKW